MRQLILAEFISLDGVIQAPGGPDEDTEGDFAQGCWTWPYWHDDIGKRFFEPMAEGDPFGDAMNGIRKYVVSTTLHWCTPSPTTSWWTSTSCTSTPWCWAAANDCSRPVPGTISNSWSPRRFRPG
jgi:hypothetical protein